MTNPVNWFEIPTIDLERAKAFYSKVFKLEFQFIEMPPSKMVMFGEPGKAGSGGALVQSAETKPSSDGSVVYFSCEDVINEIALAEKEGGTVAVPKTDIGEFGFFAQIIDTEGNRIGLHSEK